jgi:hypothetical protein
MNEVSLFRLYVLRAMYLFIVWSGSASISGLAYSILKNIGN